MFFSIVLYCFFRSYSAKASLAITFFFMPFQSHSSFITLSDFYLLPINPFLNLTLVGINSIAKFIHRKGEVSQHNKNKNSLKSQKYFKAEITDHISDLLQLCMKINGNTYVYKRLKQLAMILLWR